MEKCDHLPQAQRRKRFGSNHDSSRRLGLRLSVQASIFSTAAWRSAQALCLTCFVTWLWSGDDHDDRSGRQHLLASKFKLGADLCAAPMPAGKKPAPATVSDLPAINEWRKECIPYYSWC
jgi:hypothetical protein